MWTGTGGHSVLLRQVRCAHRRGSFLDAATPLASAPPPPGVSASPTAGIEENIAGLLCYVLGWITGLVFILIDKRPFVRFHAMQSIITFCALHVLSFVLGIAFMLPSGGVPFRFGWSLGLLLHGLLNIVGLVAWVVCMVKAFKGERYRLPVIGDLAENYAR